jgi:hypothetical protein
VCLQGKTAVVFFDEFDSPHGGEPLGWLKYFLAPMQDGVFKEGGETHPIGKAILVARPSEGQRSVRQQPPSAD